MPNISNIKFREETIPRIPIIFEKVFNEVFNDDDRFMRVKIWLMHLEENYNGSYFSKSVVESALSSLANTPILGYIEDNSEGELDFSDHRMELERDSEGEIKVKYMCQAYGFIPQDNNAKFEKKVGDDGVEREYLTCEGIIWKKWDDPIEILDRDVVKSQSMEIDKSYEGYFDKSTKLFHFTKFKFFGACILGNDVQPAMNSASVEKQFSLSEYISKEVSEKIKEHMLAYSRYQSNDIDINNKEGEEMKEKLLAILKEKFSLTEDFLTQNGIDLESFSTEEEFESKVTEVVNANQTAFSLTAQQLVVEFDSQFRQKFTEDSWGYKSYDYYYVDHDENKSLVFAQSRADNWKIAGFNYSVSGDKPTIDFESKKAFKIVYEEMSDGTEVAMNFKTKELVEYELQVKEAEARKVVEDQFSATIADKDSQFSALQEELNTVKAEFESVKEERDALQTFKTEFDRNEKQTKADELFAKFSALPEEDVSDLKEKVFEMELEKIEDELTFRMGKRIMRGEVNFSANKQGENDVNKNAKLVLDGTEYKVSENEDEKPYSHLFEKYSK